MRDLIQLMPDSLANQIAAGEVVQRPASVVKELVENSIDAGAENITVIIDEAGKKKVQVIDNGHGMSETDARMCFERHATSKIKVSEDLFKIKTKGFRGEALASIAAVAQVELKTKVPDSDLGIFIRIEGSKVVKQEHTVTESGTCLTIKNLFYNVPARKNFLKTNPVELKHVTDQFTRLALAHPEVAFSLYQNDLLAHSLTQGNLSGRIVGLFGNNYKEQLVPCLEETQHLKVHGYVGRPEFAKRTRGEQFFFVNNRFIKNNYLNHAVLNAYEALIGKEHFPFYCLFIDIDPQDIDVNIHPTKTEIKFKDERTIYGIIKAAVRQALGKFNITPSLDFDIDTNFEGHTNKLARDIPAKAIGLPVEQKNQLSHWEDLYRIAEKESMPKPQDYQESITFQSDFNTNSHEEINKEKKSPFQLHGQYIIRQVKSGMMIIDQRLAHERILYEKYLDNLKNKAVLTQQCLFPQSIEFNPSDILLIMDMQEEIKALGFDFERIGEISIVLNGIPSDLNKSSEKKIFEELIEQYKYNQSALKLDVSDNLARSLAKKCAIQWNEKLNTEAMDEIIDKLFACHQPNYTADGQPIFILFSLDKIKSLFLNRT